MKSSGRRHVWTGRAGHAHHTSAYLRRTHRDGGAVRNETVANLLMLPPAAVDAIEVTVGRAAGPGGRRSPSPGRCRTGTWLLLLAMASMLGLPALLALAGPEKRHRGGVDRLGGAPTRL